MAVISVRLNSEEEKMLSYLSEYYEEAKDAVIRHSLKDLFEDIQDRRTIATFKASEKDVRFLTAEEILQEIV